MLRNGLRGAISGRLKRYNKIMMNKDKNFNRILSKKFNIGQRLVKK